MKIKEIKFANAVKVGRSEVIVASTDEGLNNKPAFEIDLIDGNLIKIREVETDLYMYTSLANVVWFKELIDVNKIRVEDSKRNVGAGENQDRGRHLRKAK